MREHALHTQTLSKCELTLAHEANQCRKLWLFWLLDYNLNTHTQIFNLSFRQHIEESHISSLRLIYCSISTISGRFPNLSWAHTALCFLDYIQHTPNTICIFYLNVHNYGLVHISTVHHFLFWESINSLKVPILIFSLITNILPNPYRTICTHIFTKTQSFLCPS